MRRTAYGLILMVAMWTLPPAGAAQAAEVNPAWGSVSTQASKLKKSCRDYRYRYEVTPPAHGDWDLSVEVVGPDGEVAWFGYFWEGSHPATGTETFRLCRSQSEPGRYKLRAVVSNQTYTQLEAYRLPVARFRLR